MVRLISFFVQAIFYKWHLFWAFQRKIYQAGLSRQNELEKLPISQIDQQVSVNLMGTMNSLYTFLPGMKQRNSGKFDSSTNNKKNQVEFAWFRQLLVNLGSGECLITARQSSRSRDLLKRYKWSLSQPTWPLLSWGKELFLKYLRFFDTLFYSLPTWHEYSWICKRKRNKTRNFAQNSRASRLRRTWNDRFKISYCSWARPERLLGRLRRMVLYTVS